MIRIKDGVDVRNLHYKIWDAAYIIADIYREFGKDLTITAGLDGVHRTASLHYIGAAMDIRTRNLSDADEVFEKIKGRLSPCYDVVKHSTHIHIEYQPKTPDEII